MAISHPAADLEHKLIKRVAAFRCDPLGFVLFAFPWGEPDSELAGATGPRQWQHDLLDELGRKLREGHQLGKLLPILMARASGHGIGKSTLVAWVILWALSTMADGRVVVTANTDTQLRTKTWPEVTKWLRLAINRHWFKGTATSVYSADPAHERLWRADAIPWSETNTEAFAGLHNAGRRVVLIFDEASAIHDKIWEVSEGALTDKDTEIIWFAFGNPTRNTGRFRECFGRFRHRWACGQIDSRTVEGTNAEQIAKWIEDYGEDSDFVRVRVRGVFPRAGSMQFIASDVVDAAAIRDPHVELLDPLVMGVDVARFGDDQSVIYFRKGRDGRTFPPIKLRGVETMTLASRVADEYHQRQADALFVDGGGVGAGVVDRLRQLGLPVLEVNFGGKPDRVTMGLEEGLYANKRAEMWGLMREWLKGGAIPDDAELKADLTGTEYGYNKDSAIQLERKEDMKKRGLASPDIADALALTFAYPVARRTHAPTWPAQGSRVVTDYDPWTELRAETNVVTDYDPYQRAWQGRE